MKQIKYVGTADFREVSAADIKKAGFEGDFSKVTFERGVLMDVEDDGAADALLEHAIFSGEFEEASEKDLERLEKGDDLGPSFASERATRRQAAAVSNSPGTNLGVRGPARSSSTSGSGSSSSSGGRGSRSSGGST